MGNVYSTTAQTGKDSHEVARETIKPILDYETAKAIARHSAEKEADVATHLKQTAGEMKVKDEADQAKAKRIAGIDQMVNVALQGVKLNPDSGRFSVDAAMQDIAAMADSDGRIKAVMKSPEVQKVLREKISLVDKEYRDRVDHEQKRELQSAQVENQKSQARLHDRMPTGGAAGGDSSDIRTVDALVKRGIASRAVS